MINTMLGDYYPEYKQENIMKRYEYKHDNFTVKNGTTDDFEQWLNAQGAMGWNLVYLKHFYDGSAPETSNLIRTFCYFSREVLKP